MLDLEPVGDGLPQQQVADFLRRIRPVRVAPKFAQLGPIEVRQACQAVPLASSIDDGQLPFSSSAHLSGADPPLLDSPLEASRRPTRTLKSENDLPSLEMESFTL